MKLQSTSVSGYTMPKLLLELFRIFTTATTIKYLSREPLFYQTIALIAIPSRTKKAMINNNTAVDRLRNNTDTNFEGNVKIKRKGGISERPAPQIQIFKKNHK